MMTVWVDGPAFTEPGVLIVMDFDLAWRERLELLQRGAPVSVIGRIREICATDIKLHECELVT